MTSCLSKSSSPPLTSFYLSRRDSTRTGGRSVRPCTGRPPAGGRRDTRGCRWRCSGSHRRAVVRRDRPAGRRSPHPARRSLTGRRFLRRRGDRHRPPDGGRLGRTTASWASEEPAPSRARGPVRAGRRCCCPARAVRAALRGVPRRP